MATRLAWILGTVSCCLVACSSSSSDDGARPSTQVKDKLGRTCAVTNAATVSCDKAAQPAAACKTGATACFTLGGGPGGPGAICASCCAGDSATSVAADCSEIACGTPTDCPKEYGRCVSGACRY